MDAVNDTHTPQFVDFGWDELVPAAIIDATFSNLQTYAEPSRATSSAETEERIVHGSTRIEDLTSSISSAAQNTPHATPPRAKIIPKAEWERYRPIIEKLYVAQGLTLSTTREILAEDHGFVADEAMYKKRLRVWKLKKNYTKEDKEKALDRLHLHEPEDTVASITINNMPLKSSRLGRPVQQNGRRVPLRHGNLRRPRPVITTQAFDGRRNSMTASLSAAMNHDSPVLSNNKLAVTEADLSHGLIPRIQLQQSPESRRIEQILRFAQSYWSSYATRPASHRNYGFGKDLEDVFDNLVTARRFLGRNDTRAFVMLNKACFGIRALLMAQPYRLLDQIILEFSNPQWSTHGQIRVSLLSYLESMSQRFLGPEHPVSKTAACLAVNGNATELTSKFSRLCIDTASSTLADSQYDVVIDIQYNVLYFLEQSGNLDDADRLCQQMDILCQKIVKAKEKSDGACVAAREASKVLAWIRGRRNDFKGAERILLQTVEDTIQATGLPNGDRAGIGVCSDLGTVYRCLGNATESAKYFRLAIEGGLWLWGEDSTEVLDNVRRLEVVLGKYGMEEQLKQLRKRWKRVWERLENELKN